jgi:hypothetical protein
MAMVDSVGSRSDVRSMATYPEKETYPADEVTEGVGLSPDRIGPAPVARAERSIGGVLLAVSAVLFVLGTIALMFGLAPVAFLILALVPVAWLGAWLRRHGSERLTNE